MNHYGAMKVTLVGGPADGCILDNYRGGTVLVHTDEEAGLVARYRPTRDKTVLRFREWDRRLYPPALAGWQSATGSRVSAGKSP